MWLLDQWAERHIIDAQSKGEFDDLPGTGEPLTLDDDSHVPLELRAGYRLLKMQAAFLLSSSNAERQYSCLKYSRGSAKMIPVIRR